MLFDKPYTRYRTHCGSFKLVALVWPHLRWEWWAIIHLAQWSRLCSTISWKCLVITPFGRSNCNFVYALLLWGLLHGSTSRYSGKVRRMSNLSALTFKSASQSCLRIHLDCLLRQSWGPNRLLLTAVKSNLFGPQDCLKRCRGGLKVSSYLFLGFH